MLSIGAEKLQIGEMHPNECRNEAPITLLGSAFNRARYGERNPGRASILCIV